MEGKQERPQRKEKESCDKRQKMWMRLRVRDIWTSSLRTRSLHVFAGSQLRENLRRWLSPPDSSANYNMACDAHHKGTAEWFIRGSIFKEWKSTGSLLWVHGKRMLLFSFPLASVQPPMATFYSGFRKEQTLVRHYQT